MNTCGLIVMLYLEAVIFFFIYPKRICYFGFPYSVIKLEDRIASAWVTLWLNTKPWCVHISCLDVTIHFLWITTVNAALNVNWMINARGFEVRRRKSQRLGHKILRNNKMWVNWYICVWTGTNETFLTVTLQKYLQQKLVILILISRTVNSVFFSVRIVFTRPIFVADDKDMEKPAQ